MKLTTKRESLFPPKLTQLEQLSLYEQMLGKIVVNKAIKSPLRKDNNPSFCIYKSKKSDNIYWKDFATGDGGSVRALQERLGLAIQPKAYTKKVPTFEAIHIHHIERDFFPNDYEVWLKWGISYKTLMKYGVICIQEIFTNGRPTWRYTDNNPIYGWECRDEDGNSYWKYYRPNGTKGNKWKSYGSSKTLQGESQISDKANDILIITKSMKDCMLLRELGYEALAPQSEHQFLSPAKYRYYKNRFDSIYLLYDNDETGVNQTENICKKHKEIMPLFVPKSKGVKDISDYYFKFGKEDTKNLLHQLIAI